MNKKYHSSTENTKLYPAKKLSFGVGGLILLYWCNSIDVKVTFAGHLDRVLVQKKQKWHSWSGTRPGQPWATSSHGGAGKSPASLLAPPAQIRQDTQSPAYHQRLHGQLQGSQHCCHR